jgi:alcohol dehydrogenase
MAGNESNPQVPMEKVISRELEILGSHGMQAHKYHEMIEKGKLNPSKLIGKTITIEESLKELTDMNNFSGVGVAVIDLNK